MKRHAEQEEFYLNPLRCGPAAEICQGVRQPPPRCCWVKCKVLCVEWGTGMNVLNEFFDVVSVLQISCLSDDASRPFS
jgi:hypothetical protein